MADDRSVSWRPGFRHQVRLYGEGWKCVDCGKVTLDWPSDLEACPGPDEDPQTV